MEVEFSNSDSVNAQVLISELANPVRSGRIRVLKAQPGDDSYAERDASRDGQTFYRNNRNRLESKLDESGYSENPKRNLRQKKVRYEDDSEKENRKAIFKASKVSIIEDESSQPWHKQINKGGEDDGQENPYITEVSLDEENNLSENESEPEESSEESYYSHYSQEDDNKPIRERKLPSPRLYKPPRNSSFPRIRAVSPQRDSSPAIVIKDVLPEEKLKKMRKREKRKKMLEGSKPRKESKERDRTPGLDLYAKEKRKRALKSQKEESKQKKKKVKKVKKKEVLKEVSESDQRRNKLQSRVGATYTMQI